jgi:uncharacterized protein (DUF3820 family)
MDDESLMPYGKYKGEKMANIPPDYLLWIYENNKCTIEVQEYIQNNLDTIKAEIAYNQKKGR